VVHLGFRVLWSGEEWGLGRCGLGVRMNNHQVGCRGCGGVLSQRRCFRFPGGYRQPKGWWG
jgi:hypothetical protein